MPFKILAVLAKQGAQFNGPMGRSTDWVLRLDTEPKSTEPFELTVTVQSGTDIQGVKEAAQRCVRHFMNADVTIDRITVREAPEPAPNAASVLR